MMNSMEDRATSELVSAIITTHNRAEFVGEAIESVLAQTHKELEIIVVDSASTDGTPGILQRYTDPRIRIIRLQQDKGLAAARNTGIAKAQGTFIACLDDDDLWAPEKIALEADVFRTASKKTGACYSDFFDVYADGTKNPLVRVYTAESGPDLLGEVLVISKINPSFALLRREAVVEVGGFDERYFGCDEWELWLRLVEKGWELRHQPRMAGLKRRHTSQISFGRMQELVEEMYMLLNEWLTKPQLLQRIPPNHAAATLLNLGNICYATNRFNEARATWRKALRLKPSLISPGLVVRWSLSCLPTWMVLPLIKQYRRLRHQYDIR